MRNESDLPDLMTVKELTEYTQLSVPTFARWRGEGVGPKFLKIGGAVRYRKSDVLAWLKEQETDSEPESPDDIRAAQVLEAKRRAQSRGRKVREERRAQSEDRP